MPLSHVRAAALDALGSLALDRAVAAGFPFAAAGAAERAGEAAAALGAAAGAWAGHAPSRLSLALVERDRCALARLRPTVRVCT